MQIGETALHIAAKKGDTTILNELLKYNPKLDVLDVVRFIQTITLLFYLFLIQ